MCNLLRTNVYGTPFSLFIETNHFNYSLLLWTRPHIHTLQYHMRGTIITIDDTQWAEDFCKRSQIPNRVSLQSTRIYVNVKIGEVPVCLVFSLVSYAQPENNHKNPEMQRIKIPLELAPHRPETTCSEKLLSDECKRVGRCDTNPAHKHGIRSIRTKRFWCTSKNTRINTVARWFQSHEMRMATTEKWKKTNIKRLPAELICNRKAKHTWMM